MKTLVTRLEQFLVQWELQESTFAFTPFADNQKCSLLFAELSSILSIYSDYIRLVNYDSGFIEVGQIALELKPGTTWRDLERAMNEF
jgi:hypothetical protein